MTPSARIVAFAQERVASQWRVVWGRVSVASAFEETSGLNDELLWLVDTDSDRFLPEQSVGITVAADPIIEASRSQRWNFGSCGSDLGVSAGLASG